MMLLVIDNYDSFTYNLFQYLGQLGAEMEVYRNDRIGLEEIETLSPDGIVISPGPGRPEQAGICLEVIEHFGPKLPLFGVCLGHQAIGHVYGGSIVGAEKIMHGKTSMIRHEGDILFRGVPSPFEATRYHSLIIDPASFPDCLECTARTDAGEIMGLRHREYPTFGVQFHPESILTEAGIRILSNFLDVCTSV